jgi:hypothetical protein
VRLVGIHRRFIARCYRGGCPAVALCKAESYTTAAGFILQTVKRPQARYKPASHGIVPETPDVEGC